MTRVYAKANPDRIGTIVGDAPHGDVLVEWDGEGHMRWRLQRDQLVELEPAPAQAGDELAIMPEGAKPPSIEVRCLEILDNLRDAVVLEIETKMNDIRRLMKKEGKR